MRHLLPLPLLALACCTSSEGSSALQGTTETIEVRTPAPPRSPDAGPVPALVVHEWGTFTAVAGTDGVALDWRPLVGHSDLPKFVYDVTRPGLRELGLSSKGDLQGRVRMETPVLYFYAAREIDVPGADLGRFEGLAQTREHVGSSRRRRTTKALRGWLSGCARRGPVHVGSTMGTTLDRLE